MYRRPCIFRVPVKIGDTIPATIHVIELSEKGQRAKLLCQCRVGGTLVLEGEAVVKIPPRPDVHNMAEHDLAWR
jgi:3-hydroxybutyryl-CoA dehydratase